jgi:tight adherence protein B
MSALGGLFFAAAALCLLACVASLLRNRRRDVATRRLRSLATRLQDPDIRSDEDSILRERWPGRGRGLDRALRFLPRFRSLELLLYRAGVATPASRFAALCLSLGIVAGLGALNALASYANALATGVAAALLPVGFVWLRKRRRMQLFEVQFPEALDLMCRALRAGHALSAGLKMVGEGLEDPIGPEFVQVSDEIALGMDVRHALANLCHRIDVGDLRFFSTAVLIQRETGGNLAEIMEKLGYVIRQRHQLYGKIRAMTAQNRLAAAVLVCTPVAFVVLMNMVSPDFIDPLFHTHEGRLLGLVCGGLTVAGYTIARRLAVVRA